MTALQLLNRLADQWNAVRHPTVPYRVRSKYSDKSANDLTTAIVDFCNFSGYFATRLASTGTFRADLQKFIPSKQRSGLPDIMAVVDGRSVFIEVKFGKDRLSEEQKEAISDLERAGAYCFIASDFRGFYEWFIREFQTAPFG